LKRFVSWLGALEAAVARFERPAIHVIFAAATLLQINAILHHGYMGQDYVANAEAAARAVAMPAPKWIVYVGTNPPAVFWLAALVHWLTGSTSYVAATSFVFMVANTVALYVWWLLAKATIRDATLRVAAMLALAFMPARLIHSVVYAGDAVVVLPFTLVVWFSYELFRSTEPRRQMRLAVALSAALVASVASKYTTASALPLELLLIGAFAGSFRSRKVLLVTVVLVVIVPACVAAYYRHVYAHMPTTDERRIFWGHDMTWRSLLMLRAGDVDVLHARWYMDMLEPNVHSYPGLLHYSTFTDPLNIFQYDPTDGYFGARSDWHQRLMTFAVRWAVALSLLMIAATATYAGRAVVQLRALREGLAGRRLAVLFVLLFSLAFFANIAVFLPFVQQAYHCGYWLSRLVLPALLGFALLAFALVDELPRWPGARLAVLAYALVHAAVNASFLWVLGA
jgi:hypothetical protein